MSPTSRLLAALGFLSACSSSLDQGPSQGQLGHAQFAWDRGALGCLFGCDASAPMAVRAIAHLEVVNADKLPAFTVASDQPGVIDFTAVEGHTISCEAHAAGKATVTLSDASSGSVVDRFDVHSEDVAKIAPQDSTEYVQRYEIMVGGTAELPFRLTGASGHDLVGIGAVDYSVTGGLGTPQVTLVSAVAQVLANVLAGTSQEYIDLTAGTAGTGSLVVTAPSGAELDIPAAIVDASAATGVTLAARADLQAGSGVIFDATVSDGSERIHSAACMWSLTPSDGPIQIDWSDRDTIQLKASAKGSATLGCAVGSAAGQLAVAAK
jgi:hypothetical protein